MSLINKLFISIKSRGFIETLYWIIFGYIKPNKFIVFFLNLEIEFDHLILFNQIEIKKISLNELKSIRDQKNDYPIEFYCDKTENYKTPFVAYWNDEIAAIHWLVSPEEHSRFLNIKEGDFELNHNTVLPQFRGNNLAESLMTFIIKKSKENGCKRMFGVVHVDNIPSYKQLIRLGFEPVEILNHFGFFRPKATLKYVK